MIGSVPHARDDTSVFYGHEAGAALQGIAGQSEHNMQKDIFEATNSYNCYLVKLLRGKKV
jgi:hypothetical protein